MTTHSLYRDESTPDRRAVWTMVERAAARIGESMTRHHQVLRCNVCGHQIDESGGCAYDCPEDYTPWAERKPELTTLQRWVRTDKLVDQGPYDAGKR